MRVLWQQDCNLDLLRDKHIGVIGYGNQGRAQALNLHDGGFQVRIGLRADSPTMASVEADGLAPMELSALCDWADILLVLIPDENIPKLFESHLQHLSSEKIFGFAHGFCLHYGAISLNPGQGAFLVAPKGPGVAVRQRYVEGKGIPCLVAVTHDSLWGLAFAYGAAIGGGKGGLLQTSFKEETECDLFGEQVVLCGGLPKLIQASFDTLVGAGFSPEMAYFECLHETKLIADLLYREGIAGMKKRISNTAEYGSYVADVFDSNLAERLRGILGRIQDGSFARSFLQSRDLVFQAARPKEEEHPIESIGREVREVFGFNKETP